MAKKRIHRPEGYSRLESREPQHPKARGKAPDDSAAPSPRRQRLENASRPMLRRLQALPAFVLPVVMCLLLFLGLALPSAWTGVLLLVLAVFLGWLTALSWPRVRTGSRIIRLAVVLVLLGLSVLKFVG